ncbi:MAG: hypothetical protein MUF01_12250 [Bryobacterales bacterium]|jgi:hypothetical protein|nr:hypothetical protein [Bryobacterales bacterium]
MPDGILRTLGLLLVLATTSLAAIWTDRLGDFERSSAEPFTLKNATLAEEYGFEQGESAAYKAGGRTFRARAYQMADTTGAVAMYQYLLPEGAQQAEYERQAIAESFDMSASQWDSTVLVQFLNYVMVFEGDRPTWEVLKAFLGYAPKLGSSTRPPLTSYLPSNLLVNGSQRYILGPESLSLFLPEVPSGIAAFSLGAEAQVARYRDQQSTLKLAIVSYPTPQMARKKLEEYQELPSLLAKREGSMIVACTNVEDRDLAERVLSQVRYRAAVTVNQTTKSEAQVLRDLIINIIILAAVLCGLALLAGTMFGGLRFLRRRAAGEDDQTFVSLHID